MDTAINLDPSATISPVDHCWNRIGVTGDASCPELAKHVHCRNCPVFADASQSLFSRETPADYLAEWTDRLAHTVSQPPGDSVALVNFRLGEEWFAWNARSVVEVTEPKVIRRIPHRTNRLLLGLVNIRGELRICVSLRELLSIPHGSDQGSDGDLATRRFVVVAQGTFAWVFPSDAVSAVRRMPLTALSNVPTTVSHSASPYSQGVFCDDGRTIGYLDDKQIFSALEGKLR
jgi:chemotaxis-related protein WspD